MLDQRGEHGGAFVSDQPPKGFVPDADEYPDLTKPDWQNEQRRILPTCDYKLDALNTKPDETLRTIGHDIERQVNTLITEGAVRVTIKWCNIPDRAHNPHQDNGYFRIIGVRPKPTPPTTP